MVLGAGLEPARLCGQEILSLSCLPIPPPEQIGGATRDRTGVQGFAGLCVTTPP